MQLMFYGMILILLDVEVTLGNAAWGLLPDMVGYYLLLRGSQQRKAICRLPQKLLLVMIPVSLAVYVLNWFQGNYQMRFLVWAAEVACVFPRLWISRSAAKQCGADADNTVLSIWLFWAVLHLISKLLQLIPVVGWVCGLADLVMGLCLLALMYSRRKKR